MIIKSAAHLALAAVCLIAIATSYASHAQMGYWPPPGPYGPPPGAYGYGLPQGPYGPPAGRLWTSAGCLWPTTGDLCPAAPVWPATGGTRGDNQRPADQPG